MRERLIRFMSGRYGVDELNRFLQIFDLILLLLAVILRGTAGKVLFPLAFALLAGVYYRMLSKDRYKRSRENAQYLHLRSRVTGWFAGLKTRWQQRKDYKFFTCPSCKTTLRVPRGKGKIEIVCRRCGSRFSGKS